ncbi:MAG: hypothetical protein MJA30_06345 [Cytophagales bacterium]|nr:hypothetical protein [Cytophagales bacterium]
MTILNSIFSFLSHGKLADYDFTGLEKVWIVIKIYVVLIIFSVLFEFGITSLFDSYLTRATTNEDRIPFQGPDFYVSVFLLLTVPVHEELTFRFFLSRFDLQRIAVSCSLLVGYFLFWLVYESLTFPAVMDRKVTTYLYLFAIGLIVYPVAYLGFNKLARKSLAKWWDTNLLIVVYGVSVIFSLVHFDTSYLSSLASVLIGIVLLVPTFLFALVASFIRLSVGFKYAVLFHLLFNLPEFLIVSLL